MKFVIGFILLLITTMVALNIWGPKSNLDIELEKRSVSYQTKDSIKAMPKGAKLLNVNGAYFSFEYMGNCFLSKSLHARTAVLTTIPCKEEI